MSVTVEVLAERIESLDARVETGMRDIKTMIDQIQAHEIRDALEAVRIDVAVFKARWSMISVFGAAIVSVIVSLAVKWIGGH